MINNEFNLIGIAVSEYETDQWGNSLLRVEIEKMGSKEGNVFEAEVKIYGNNRIVDTSRSILGEQIAVNGYIDFFVAKTGKPVLKLIAQRVYVLGEQRKRMEEIRSGNKVSPAPQGEPTPARYVHDEPASPAFESPYTRGVTSEADDGDLPF